MWCPSRKFFYELYSVTQSFLLVFMWSSDKITVSNKKKTYPRAYQSISDNYIMFPQKYYSLLCQYELFTHTCSSKIAIVFRDAIFYLLWYNLIHWSKYIYNNSYFLMAQLLICCFIVIILYIERKCFLMRILPKIFPLSKSKLSGQFQMVLSKFFSNINQKYVCRKICIVSKVFGCIAGVYFLQCCMSWGS